MHRTLWSGTAYLAAACMILVAYVVSAPASVDYAAECAKATGDNAIAACTRLIASGKLKGKGLAAAHHNRGDAFYYKGDYEHAIGDYSEQILIDPKNAVAYKDRGLSYYQKSNYDSAIADLNQAIVLHPNFARAYQVRGDAFYYKRDYERAIANYAEQIRIDPKNAGAYKDRGLSYYQKSNYDSAIADLNQAIVLDPNFARAYQVRGDAYYYKRDYEHAIANYAEQIRIDPKNAVAYKDRGLSYYRMSDYPHALIDLNHAIALDPDFARAYQVRGDTYYAKGDDDHAIADYGDAIRLDPKSIQYLNQRALLYERRGSLDRALADFKAALALDPQQAAAKERVARLAQKLATPAAANVRPSRPSAPEIRVALVIGNSSYANVTRLPNPKSDAEKITQMLRGIGFSDVTLVLDVPRDKLSEAFKAFRSKADRADWAMVYYAGHGMEFGGVNYLIPIDAKLAADRDISFEAVALDDVLLTVEGAKKLRLVILDACRNNPFVSKMKRSLSTRSVGRGLAEIEPEGATLVAYAAKHGQVAEDGEGGNSPFVTALVKNIDTPGLEINLLFRKVRDEVLKATGRRQEPFVYGSLPAEEFYFRQP